MEDSFPEPTNLIRIESPWFVAGVEWRTYSVGNTTFYNHRCAPIIHYMRDWGVIRILNYCAKRGWKWKVI